MVIIDEMIFIINQMLNFYGSIYSGEIISAIIILIIGAIFASEVSKLVKKIIDKIGADKALDKTGAKKYIKKGGIKLSISDLISWLVKWFFMLLALMFAIDYLNLPQATEFLGNVLSYLPSIMAALVIFTIGLVISQMVYEAISGVGAATGIKTYNVAAILAKWIIAVMSMLVVVEQVGIGSQILQLFAVGNSIMFAIAGGIAFGLGGQYHAKEILDDVKNKIYNK